MNLDTKNLALFVRVAALEAIGRAGEEFGLSSTNASQRIQSLEAELGVKLFYRTTRSVTLTHDGKVFLEHAKCILEDIEEVKNVFKGDDKCMQGLIRITVPSSFGRLYVLPFIENFLRLYPQIELELDFNDNRVDIVEQGYDLAFRIGALPSSSLVARRIDDNPVMLVASPHYIEHYGMPATPEALKEHVCIPFGKLAHWQFRDSQQQLHQVVVSGPISVNWGDAINDLIESGMGVGLANLWRVGPSLKAGRIVPVLTKFQVWPETKIWAIHPACRTVPARVNVFLDYAVERIRRINQERYGEEWKQS
ncbi:MAG: LysR family transcriptional regulator [Pseudomonadota bacterium]